MILGQDLMETLTVMHFFNFWPIGAIVDPKPCSGAVLVSYLCRSGDAERKRCNCGVQHLDYRLKLLEVPSKE